MSIAKKGIMVNQQVNDCWKPLFIKRAGVRYVIMMGGRGAGRSFVASQYVLSKLISPDYFRCAIMRLVQGDIRSSIWQEIVDRVEEQGISENIRIGDNEMKMRYAMKNPDGTDQVNSINALGFKASSGDRSAKLKSLASYNTIIIEEAEEIGEAEFMQLDNSLRTVKGNITVVMCLNTPPKNHWIIKEFFNLEPTEVPGFTRPVLKPEVSPYTEFLYFNLRSNENNLDAFTIQKYLRYKDTKPDYYWHMIEGLCPDTVRGRIYSGWEIIDELPFGAKLLAGGMDLGWFPDPLVAINLYYYDGYYIVDEVLHGTELKTEYIAQVLLNQKEKAPFFSDTNENRLIEALRDEGVNITQVEKGEGSVDYGISVVSGIKIKVTRRSHNTWTAYENYSWKENKDGESLGIPNHAFSDPMDAVRYAAVSVIDGVNPEQEERILAEQHVAHTNFVNNASQRHGL